MANTKSALKRIRQAKMRTLRNKSAFSRIKTQLKKTTAKVSSTDALGAEEEFRRLSSCLDKAVKHGVIHKNKANRKKSSFNKAIAALQTT